MIIAVSFPVGAGKATSAFHRIQRESSATRMAAAKNRTIEGSLALLAANSRLSLT